MVLESSIDIEEQVIGGLLINNNLFKELYLEPKHFQDKNHQILMYKILDIYKRNDAVDIVMLVDEIKDDSYLCDIAFRCCDCITVLNNFVFYQERIEEAYKIGCIKEKIEELDEKKLGYAELIDNIQKINNECTTKTDSTNTLLSPEDIFELITTEKNVLEFKKLHFFQDKLGILSNTVNVIAARTSQGKSAFALNLMNDLSQTYKCLYFNMEMTEKEIYQRLVSINSQIPINDFGNWENNNNITSRLLKGIEEIHNRKIKIYQGSKNIKAIRTILTKESRKEHCVVFIDYIGYVYSSKYTQNDRERIGEVVRELQIMSKELNITIFMIAQINREGNDEPTLVNLKDSGELEQTAHCVMMIHNPNKDINEQCPQVEILIPKNRSGQLGKVIMTFDKKTQTFKFTNN